MLDEKIKHEAKPTQEKMEYRCPRCKAEYTQMDVLDSVDVLGRGSGFVCKRCGTLLIYLDDDGNDTATDDTPAKFNKQFAKLLSILQKIDDAFIPATSGENAMEQARPVPRDNVINPGVKSVPVAVSATRPTAVKGVAYGPEVVEVSITNDADITAEQQNSEKERKAKIAAQNQLPEWHTRSTVTGEITNAVKDTASTAESNGVSLKIDDVEEKKPTDDAALDAYFAQLNAERMAQASADPSDEEDEEDDEFEDVDVAASTVDNTPSKIEGGSPSKRIKLEDGSAAAIPTPTPIAGDDKSGESSDEDEFEDVA
jgi:transcription initiation factor TFIIE subunit alpha